jgi:hypothetical protein
MGSFKRGFAPLDLEIIDRVDEVAWAQIRAQQPNRDTVSVGERQEALREKIFGVARILGSGHIDFDTLAELVLGEDLPSLLVHIRDVRYWHIADIRFDAEHVCFAG